MDAARETVIDIDLQGVSFEHAIAAGTHKIVMHQFNRFFMVLRRRRPHTPAASFLDIHTLGLVQQRMSTAAAATQPLSLRTAAKVDTFVG